MFSVGDLVVHPMHGAGVIDDIVRERVAGSTQEYYVFKMPVGGLLLKIPIAKSQLIGLRAIIGRAEAEQLISSIPEIAVDQDSNWNKRYRENLERLKSGDLYQVAPGHQGFDAPGTGAGACPPGSGKCSTLHGRSCSRNWFYPSMKHMMSWRPGWTGP